MEMLIASDSNMRKKENEKFKKHQGLEEELGSTYMHVNTVYRLYIDFVTSKAAFEEENTFLFY